MTDKFTSVELQASYGIGLQMGEQLRANPFDGLDISAVQEGLADAFNLQPAQVTNDVLREAFNEIHQRMQAAKNEQFAEAQEAGIAFLAENAKRDDVTVTESGLQYEVVNAGNGDTPTAASTVRVHYHGTLLDGTVFDSSYDRGEPAEFPVGGVIKGWTEALQLMQVGAKLRLFVPHDLAYGEQGAGGAIAPFSTLVFDVELLDIIA
ncbi:FKBP-type peptidyl-prolyl cis-trans isomerase [Paraglaciecola polaris]|uniref:Peptidyl-prolyl cis-trans isomerase n=1 Tax=Paraglaciecola polaris LMG 21857 TaxID=1129793 RepID=K6YS36_9ALTE|nr:FKBP-type peptidyl-prolyl cis-trans isomerase [Paraglaciecola polaris]GAC35539.1 FKBP-type peptidyl-prolyl cis-trans isomerase FklB [Paraglaciecola polaris LMG 21857]